MTSTKTAARVAGLLYLLNGSFAPFSLLYIPSAFLVAGDASATANKIRASQFLFRAGIVGELISATIFVFVGLAFYHLLKGVNKKHALLLLILVVVSVPISFLNEMNRLAALMLSRGPAYLSVFDRRQVDALVMALMSLHGSGLLLVQIFWGLWLFPFGILVFQSRFLPRILGVLLVLAGVGYVAASLASLLVPAYGHSVFMAAGLVGGIGEGSTILWLLIKGAAANQPSLEHA
ncbi:MAG: DUF4386 domain-containing protein [Bryobacteraceae bacterium]|jgi:hypothetical protein